MLIFNVYIRVVWTCSAEEDLTTKQSLLQANMSRISVRVLFYNHL